ncbi:hypothetical protein [Aeoliella sp.]|uniref:hypothetical protein n=1 Tax=Aeoliella sp. TaxID=2795800 RepID=UPI003CCBC581
MNKHTRRGVTMLIVLAVIGASGLLLAYAMGSIVDHHRQGRLRHEHRQCRLLSESGVDRAEAQLAADADYTGERWQLAASETGLAKDAVVVIEVKPSDSGTQITATTNYPATGQSRITHTQNRAMEDE